MSDRLQIPGLQVFERGWLSANNVLFTDDTSTTLIDSGYVTHQAQTLALVQNALDGKILDRLVNTHLHSDHCGGNYFLQNHYTQLETLIPPGEAKAVAIWDEQALSYEATGQLCPRFKFEGVLRAGQTLRLASLDWEVHAAPGHDPHSVILFEPTHKVLISADALCQAIALFVLNGHFDAGKWQANGAAEGGLSHRVVGANGTSFTHAPAFNHGAAGGSLPSARSALRRRHATCLGEAQVGKIDGFEHGVLQQGVEQSVDAGQQVEGA